MRDVKGSEQLASANECNEPKLEIIGEAPNAYLRVSAGVLPSNRCDSFGADVIGRGRHVRERNETVARELEARRGAYANAKQLLTAGVPQPLHDALTAFLSSQEQNDA